MTNSGPPALDSAPRYPAAERGATVDLLHGHEIADPYRWLESGADPRTVRWAEEQDILARSHLDAVPGRDRLRARLEALQAAGSVGVPVWRGERAFFTRRTPGQEHAVLVLHEAFGTERTLLDPMVIDPAGTTTLDTWTPSPDGRLLAYQISAGGDEESLLHVLDVDTGELRDGPIDRCRYSPVAWRPDGGELFYVRRLPPGSVPAGEEQFHRRVWLHTVGGDPAGDTEIHGAGLDPTNYYGVQVSRDGNWLVVSASAGTAPRDDVWVAEWGGDRVLREVQVGIDARCAAWVARDGRLYLLTDREAPRGRLCVTDPRSPGYERWADAVPEALAAVLENVTLLADAAGATMVLAAHTLEASSRLGVIDAATGRTVADVALPGVGTVTGLSSHPDGGPTAWIGYTDFGTPPGVLTWALDDVRAEVWQEAPGAAGPPGIVVTEAECLSADGTGVHLFVMTATDRAPDPAPTVLYGYGGFNVSLTPAYSPATLAWVEAGGTWAVANLRGGSERGEQWHRAGMRGQKQNVFDDFAAAAGWLIAEGWTSAGQLAVLGGSNGGLLVGAAITQFPQLFAAAVCSAPLLDMLRYELFGLGRTWNDEYGTAADPEEFGWLLGYSPYHRAVPGPAYPAVLFTTFDSDTRVDPLHARKTCAALQYGSTGTAPILLRREVDVGHGARSVSRSVALSVDQLSFLAAHTGVAVDRA